MIGIKIKQKPDNGILSSTYKTEFIYKDIFINIQQAGFRQIVLFDKNNDIEKIFTIFNTIDRFMQIFDGKFIPIISLNAIDENEKECNLYKNEIENYFNSRLSYFSSQDIYLDTHSKLCEPIKFLNEKTLQEWADLQSDLDLIHQSMLYFTCDNKLPIDIRLAHMIECFEPLSEFLSTKDKFFVNTGSDGKPTLKSCIDAIICKYGKSIFDKEYSKNKEKFLQLLVNTRVRIMHTKCKFQKDYIKGPVILMLCGKISLLYRSIILTLLNIDLEKYEDNLKKDVNEYNTLSNFINDFIENKLKKED